MKSVSLFDVRCIGAAFILLAQCLYVGCSSPNTSHTHVHAKPAESQWRGVEAELRDASAKGNSCVMLPNGSILSAKSISLVRVQDGGHVLYADGGCSVVPSNGMSRVTGEKMRMTFGSGWDVRVLRGKLLDATGSVTQDFHAEDLSKATYQVHAQDTLPIIAERVYGDAAAWRLIEDANKALLQEGGLREGMVIEIPPNMLDGPTQIKVVKQDAKKAL